VLASSAIVVHRRTLLAHGGHDPAFTGHGAEDFELMHRLSQSRPRGQRPSDYHVDYGARRADEGGFRAYFARYAEPLRDRGIHLAHAWHPPRREDPRYYEARRRNFALLRERLASE
jgi:predicted glycosyltransferase involved in capsule biosynthesis